MLVARVENTCTIAALAIAALLIIIYASSGNTPRASSAGAVQSFDVTHRITSVHVDDLIWG
jgi:hypothetical protein